MKKTALIAFLFVVMAQEGLYAQTFNASDALETTAAGTINWTSGEVWSTGIGAPPAWTVNAAQARAMTERAAYVVAIRNLLEAVKGVRVDSTSVVENFMVKSDVIKTKVDGIVRGARIVKTNYLSDGSVEVQVAMPLKGALLDVIVPETFGRPGGMQTLTRPAPMPQKQEVPKKQAEPIKQEPIIPAPAVPAPSSPDKKPEPAKPAMPPSAVVPDRKTEPARPVVPESAATFAFKGGIATGLVIDGRGLGLRPALLPRIVDPAGQEIYVGQVATRTNAVEQGVAGYARDVNAATNNFRVTDNPAVIRGLRAAGGTRTDIVVGQADAQALRRLGGNADFLQYCRVIIVY